MLYNVGFILIREMYADCIYSMLVRIACGIVVIMYEDNPRSTGLTVAAIILLNAGVFPIIAVTVGLIRIMYV